MERSNLFNLVVHLTAHGLGRLLPLYTATSFEHVCAKAGTGKCV